MYKAKQRSSSFAGIKFKVGLGSLYHNHLPNAVAFYGRHLQKEPRSREAITNLQIAYQGLGNTERANYYAQQLGNL